jgi:hypothetical protein
MCDQDDDKDDKQSKDNMQQSSTTTKDMCRSVLFLANTLPRSTQSRTRLADKVLCFPSNTTPSASLINLESTIPIFSRLELDQLSCQLKMVCIILMIDFEFIYYQHVQLLTQLTLLCRVESDLNFETNRVRQMLVSSIFCFFSVYIMLCKYHFSLK